MAEKYDFRCVRLQTLDHVISFVNKVINETRQGIITDKTAKTCLYGAQLLMGAIEKRDHEKRLDELESMVAKLEGERMRG